MKPKIKYPKCQMEKKPISRNKSINSMKTPNIQKKLAKAFIAITVLLNGKMAVGIAIL